MADKPRVVIAWEHEATEFRVMTGDATVSPSVTVKLEFDIDDLAGGEALWTQADREVRNQIEQVRGLR